MKQFYGGILMIDKDKELNKELGKHKKTNELQDYISNQIDTILAYGSYNLGLNNIDTESYAEKRLKEDLKK
jgi:hypothetical protein